MSTEKTPSKEEIEQIFADRLKEFQKSAYEAGARQDNWVTWVTGDLARAAGIQVTNDTAGEVEAFAENLGDEYEKFADGYGSKEKTFWWLCSMPEIERVLNQMKELVLEHYRYA